MNDKYPFYFYVFEAMSGTGMRKHNMTKDAPIVLIVQETLSVWDFVSQEVWKKTKYIWEIYFGHLNE